MFLFLQLHNGDGLPSVLFSLKQMFLNQRVPSQKLANPTAKCSRSVPVNNPDSRLARQRGVIQEFVQAIRSFFHGHADHVDFVERDRKSTRLNSSHPQLSRMP